MALWLAFAGEVTVVSGRPFDNARPWFLAAVGVALVSSLGWPELPACKLASQAETPARGARVVGLLGAAALMLLAVPLTIAQAHALAAAAWLLGVAGAVVTSVVPNRPRWSRPSPASLALLAITLGAFVLRAVDLANLPPEVHGDEAAVGLEARRLLTGQVTDLFGLGWYQIDEISFAISAAAMRVFGNNLFGLRMASVILGTLSVTVTFLFAQRLFSTRVAIMAASLVSVAEMHVHYSRTGFTYIQGCVLTVLLLYLLVRALERRSLLDYVLLGLVGGLSLLVYAAARIAPFLAALYVVQCLVRERLAFVRAQWLGLTVAFVFALIFLSPMAVVYSKDPSAFNVRTGDISVLSGPGFSHELSAYHVSTLNEVLAIQARKTLEAFVYSGESSQQYAHTAPLLDPWTGALFVAGVGAFAWRLRHPTYFLLTTWLWLSLLFGSVFTVDAPFSPHLVAILPLLGILPALFLEAGWRSASRLKASIGRPAFAGAAVGLLVLALVANVRDYTQIHTVALQPARFAASLGRYITQVNDHYRVYLISRPDTSVNYDTTRFLAPNPDAVDLHAAPLTDVPSPGVGKGMAFVVEAALPIAPLRLEELRRRYPGGQGEAHRNTRGDLLFTSYLVAPT
jgi:Dolichyl-phosphate-mannose-protein mannosyltransferase